MLFVCFFSKHLFVVLIFYVVLISVLFFFYFEIKYDFIIINDTLKSDNQLEKKKKRVKHIIFEILIYKSV